MIVRTIHDKDNPYVLINKSCLDDPSLSLKAKGLHAYLLSKPDDWVVRIGHLVKAHRDGRDAVRSAIDELVDAGYMIKHPQKSGPDGKMLPVQVDVHELPHRVGLSDADRSGFSVNGYPSTDNPTLLSNEVISNEVISNDLPSSKKESKPTKGYVNPDTGVTTTAIQDAYVEGMEKYEPKGRIPYARIGRIAKEMAKSGVSPDDVTQTFEALKSDGFWSSKHVSLEKVWDEMGARTAPPLWDTSAPKATTAPQEIYTPEVEINF